MSLLTTLAENLRAARRAKGMSQHALAAASGVSRSTIAVIETGARSDTTLAVIERLALGLGVTADELVRAPKAARRAKPSRPRTRRR